MADEFTNLITRSIKFFTKLQANNSKPFYEQHKAFYTSEIKKPAELLGDVLRDEIQRKTGTAMRAKLFRIHRDVRFSKDKTPYNTHLHLMWTADAPNAPAWFFGASPEYTVLGTGVMGLQGDALTAYRQMIDRQGAHLDAALKAADQKVGASISDWGPEPLKRVPKPFAPDHPQADLLKRKALAVKAPLPEGWENVNLIPQILTLMDALVPIWSILNEEFGAT